MNIHLYVHMHTRLHLIVGLRAITVDRNVALIAVAELNHSQHKYRPTVCMYVCNYIYRPVLQMYLLAYVCMYMFLYHYANIFTLYFYYFFVYAYKCLANQKITDWLSLSLNHTLREVRVTSHKHWLSINIYHVMNIKY